MDNHGTGVQVHQQVPGPSIVRWVVPGLYKRNMDVALKQTDAHKFPFIFHCEEEGCHWHTAHASWAQAAHVRLHHRANTCPLGGHSKIGRVGNPVGSTLIEKMWIELDRITKILIETPAEELETEDYRVARGQGQGVAHCLWLISSPHFESVDNVKKWAVRRYKMEHADAEFQPTPGVKGYNPAIVVQENWLADAEVDRRRPTAKRATAAPRSSVNPLELIPEDRINLATQAIKAGFPDAKIMTLAKLNQTQLDALKVQVKS